jgi:hypoxanthine phosphoribosyltransferase
MSEALRLSHPQDLFISSRDLKLATASLANHYTGVYADTDEVIAINIRKGAGAFVWDLIRGIRHRNIIYKEMKTRTMDGMEGGEVVIEEDIDINVEGRHLLIGEDILDRRVTMQAVLNHLGPRRPASIRITSMLDKVEACQPGIYLDVPIASGLRVARQFVVGNGLDYKDKFRHLPFVTVCSTETGREPEPIFYEEPGRDAFSSFPEAA